MAPRESTDTWLRRLEREARDRERRLSLLESDVREALDAIKPLLAEYELAKRRERMRARIFRASLTILGLVLIAPAFVDNFIRLIEGKP